MGQFFSRGPDGVLTAFQIKGETPTITEQERINAFFAGGNKPSTSPSTPDQPGILSTLGRGMARGIDNAQAGIFTGLQGLAENSEEGKFLGYTPQDYLDMANEQRRQRDTIDMPGSFFEEEGVYNKARSLAGTMGETAPAMLGSVLATLGGAAVGGPMGAGAGLLASTSLYTPQMLNENAEAQIEQHGYIKDWDKAVKATAAQAGVESITDKITLGVAGVLKQPVSGILKNAVKAGTNRAITEIAKRVGSATAISAVSGASEESLQTFLTRLQAEMPVGDDAAIADYIESAVVGAILEGTFGGAIGTVGGVKSVRDKNALRAAAEDAENEAVLLEEGAAKNVPAYQSLRGAEAPSPIAGFLEDQTAPLQAPDLIEQTDETGEAPALFQEEKKDIFSQEEYLNAVDTLRGEKLVSPDKIKTLLNVGRPKANAIFDELLKRKDALRAGQDGTYLRVVPKREYVVSNVAEENQRPYQVSFKGKVRGDSFQTEEDARSFAERAGMSGYEITSAKPNKYGLYEVAYDTGPTGDKLPVSRREIRQFSSAQEANAAAREYDPFYGLDTNIGNQMLAEEVKQRRIGEAVERELGGIRKTLQDKADALIGTNRTKVELVPLVDNDYLRGIGVADQNLPQGQRVVEGVTLPDFKEPIRQIIGISNDLVSPNVGPEQRAQKLNEVLTHELVHAMRNLDLLKKAEWDALYKYALQQKVPGKPYTHMQLAAARVAKGMKPSAIAEEGIAEMLRLHMKDPTAFDAKSRSLIKRLGDFIRKLLRLGQTYDGDDVMKAIFGGEVAKREVGSGGVGARGYPGDPFYSDVKVPGFYLASDRFVSGVRQDKATADQWIGMMRGRVREDELKWLRLNEWLKEQPGPISKGDLQDYIRANAVDLRERMGGSTDAPAEGYNDLMRAWSEADTPLAFSEWLETETYPPELESKVKRYLADAEQRQQMDWPRHNETTMPGGENYREVRFIIPKIEPKFYKTSHWDEANVIAHARFKTRTFDGKKTLFIEELQSDLHQQGKKYGYIQEEDAVKIKEINSALDALKEKSKEVRRELGIIKRNARDRSFTSEESKIYMDLLLQDDEILQQTNDLYDRLGELRGDGSGVPNAPFKTTWHELAFKRLVKHAVDNGFDQVAWHGSADSVAASEHYGKLDEITDEDGKKRYVKVFRNTADGNPIAEQDVTGIINFYTKNLKNYAKKYFARFGATVEFQPKKKVPDLDLNKLFENIDDWNSYLAYADNATSWNVDGSLDRATQVMYNQRDFDPLAAFRKAGVSEQVISEIADDAGNILADMNYGGDNLGTGKDENGNPNYDKWVMPITEDLRNSVEQDGLPMFSMVDARRRQIESDPKFQDWFRGSVVLDDDGYPLIVYHGTKADSDFDTFYKLSHFGSKKAANDRLASFLDQGFIEDAAATEGIHGIEDTLRWWKSKTPEERQALEDGMLTDERPWVAEKKRNMRVYPAFLNIKNPLEIYDDGILETVDDYIGEIMPALHEVMEVNPASFKKLNQAASKIALASKMDSVIKALEEAGFDGLKYKNTVEDVGSTSYVTFRPQQVKSIFNKGEWSRTDPRINYSSVHYAASAPLGQRVPPQPPRDRLAEVEARITYNNIAPVLQKLGDYLPTKTGYKYRRGVEDTLINLQDRMLTVGKLIDRMKKNGGFITNENDTYLRETLFSGQTDNHIQENERDYYNPLVETVRSLPVNQRDADEAARLNGASRAIIENYHNPKRGLAELYLYAQHAIERNAEMRKRNANLIQERPDQFAAGSGMTDAEARQIIDWFILKPFGRKFFDYTDHNSLRSKFRNLIANTNDTRVAGNLNPDFRGMLRRDGTPVDVYKDYAPLRSWIDEHLDQDDDALSFAKTGKGYNVQGKEDFGATGRASIASNIIANAILQNEEAIVRSGKNKVAMSFYNLIKDNQHVGGIDDIAEIIARKPDKYKYDPKTGVVRRVADNSMWNDPSILKVKLSGGQAYIKIKDERIARALGSKSSIGNIGAGTITKFMLGLNRFLAATRTSFNPEFLVSNLMRDMGAAVANLSEYEQAGIRRQVFANILPALNGVRHALRTGDMSSGWAKDFEEFKKFGGMTAFMGIRDLDDTIRKINKQVEADHTSTLDATLKPIKAIGKFVEDYNLAIENGTRLAAYRTLRDKFLSMSNDPTDPKNIKRAKERAAFAAKNLTVNFNMGGELKPLMNAWYLFYNAGLQGSTALLNPFIRSKKMKMIWGSVLAAGILQDILMSAISPEDDDGVKVYDKIPEHTLQTNVILMDPFQLSERGYFKIPMPYLMNGIYNMGRGLARFGRGQYTAGEAVNSVVGTIAESINPWGGSNSFLNFVAPTIVDPIVDLYQNEDFSGQPISPPENPFGISEKPSQRYWNNTSPAFVSIAHWLSRLTGGQGEFLPGAVEITPNTLEYLLAWGLGGVGTFGQRITDLAAVPLGFGKEEWSVGDVPFVRRAYGTVTERNDLTKYIAGRDDVLRYRAEVRDAVRQKDPERAKSVLAQFPEEYRVANMINKIENARKKYSQRIRKIRENPKIPDAKKTEMIKALKEKQNELVGRGNKLLLELRG